MASPQMRPKAAPSTKTGMKEPAGTGKVMLITLIQKFMIKNTTKVTQTCWPSCSQFCNMACEKGEMLKVEHHCVCFEENIIQNFK